MNNNLGEFVKSQRLMLKQKQVEAAHSAGLSQSLLSRIERGDIKTPTIETLDKLAKWLNIPLSDISAVMQDKLPRAVNFYPLIVVLASGSFRTELALEDLALLIEVQKLLREPMTPLLVDELLKARKTKAATPDK